MDSHKSFSIGQSAQDPYLGTRQIHLPCCSGNTNSFGNRRLGVDGLNIDMAHVRSRCSETLSMLLRA